MTAFTHPHPRAGAVILAVVIGGTLALMVLAFFLVVG